MVGATMLCWGLGLIATGLAALAISLVGKNLDLPKVTMWSRLLGTRGATVFYSLLGVASIVAGVLALAGLLK